MTREAPRPGIPFTMREARQFGLTRDHLRHEKYETPFRGIWVLRDPAAPPRTNLHQEIAWLARAYMPFMRADRRYSHSTALLLYGCPIRATRTLHVSVEFAAHPPTGTLITGHRYRSPLVGATMHGLPVVSPDRAIIQAGRELPLTELVIAIDHLVKPAYGGSAQTIPHEKLRAALAESSLKGVVKARQALALSCVGAESRMETILRLQLCALGVTGLELQVNLEDDDGFIGRFDLVDRVHRRIYEYDGEQHRTNREQYLKDQVRLERAREGGWKVTRFHYEDVFVHPDGVRRKLARLIR